MHNIQKDILKLLNKNAKTYSELYKPLKIKSNLFDYHLHKLLQQNLIVKSKHHYRLSSAGQAITPYLEFEKQPLIAIVLAVFKDNKLVLAKREKPAFTGYWAMPGGKLNFGETIEQAVERLCLKETGLELQNMKYLATIQEFINENKSNKHHFILLLYKVKAAGELKSGKLFSLNNLPKKIVPSDAKMLQITKIKTAKSIIEETNGRLQQELFD
jgi:ADP-ribose pyrophosphatase YjhB (NUDIX family)